MKTDVILRMTRWITTIMFFVAWVGATCQTTTATLTGVVHDSTGAVVPQVRIVLRNIAKGTSRVVMTDEEGRYNLSALEPGTYELRAERTGFTTDVQSGIVLSVGGASEINLVLKVGGVNEVVTVTDEAPLVEPSKAEVSTV